MKNNSVIYKQLTKMVFSKTSATYNWSKLSPLYSSFKQAKYAIDAASPDSLNYWTLGALSLKIDSLFFFFTDIFFIVLPIDHASTEAASF